MTNMGEVRAFFRYSVIVVLCLVSSSLVWGQEADSLEKLRAERDGLYKAILEVEKRILALEREQLESSSRAEGVSKSPDSPEDLEPLKVTLLKGTVLRAEPAAEASEVASLAAGTEITAVSVLPGNWWLVRGDSGVGYLQFLDLELLSSADSLRVFDREVVFIKSEKERDRAAKEAAAEAEKERLRRAEAGEREAEAARRRQRIFAKYADRSIAERIVAHSIWLGMTKDMAKDSMGRPSSVNRTVTEHLVREQWVYSSRKIYLYFDNGVLTSWQD